MVSIGPVFQLWSTFEWFCKKVFEKNKESKILWQFVLYAVILCILFCWRGKHTFLENLFASKLVTGRSMFMASLWCSAHGCFEGVALFIDREIGQLCYSPESLNVPCHISFLFPLYFTGYFVFPQLYIALFSLVKFLFSIQKKAV